MKNFIGDFLAKELNNYLHRNPQTADIIKGKLNKVKKKEKELVVSASLPNERAKKANLHNKKLRDCRYHYNDEATGKEKN